MSILTNLPDPKDEYDIVLRARSSREGMGELLDIYMPLVKTNAHKWKRYTSMPVDDLYQEGLLGLMGAARRYDPSFGTKFTTWAVCCIEGSIRSSITKEKRHDKTVSLSTILNDNQEIEGLVADTPDLFAEDTLTSLSNKIKFQKIMSQREIDLIQTRYNLDVE